MKRARVEIYFSLEALHQDMSRNKNKGFTLIELLVVIAVIGLLAGIVLVSLNIVRKKARDAKRISDLKQIYLAMQLYYDDNNTYPAIYGDDRNDNWALLASALSPYISKLPKDPVGGGVPGSPYYYAYWNITPDWWGGSSSCNGYNVLYASPTEGTVIHEECTSARANSAPITIVVGETP